MSGEEVRRTVELKNYFSVMPALEEYIKILLTIIKTSSQKKLISLYFRKEKPLSINEIILLLKNII